MNKIARHPLFPAAIFIVASSLALFAPALFGGKMLWGYDIAALAYPFKMSAERSLAFHEWPLWMPEFLGGMPGIASSNLDFLHPVDLILTLLRVPVTARFGIDASVETALAGLGMLFFLSRLGLNNASSFLGAFFYQASGSLLSLLFAGHVNQFRAAAMIPWVFWAAQKALDEESLWASCLCGVALSLQLLGLGAQLFAYTVPALAAFVIWSPRPGPKPGLAKKMIGLSVALILALLLAAPQIVPTLQYLPYSTRQAVSWDAFSGEFFSSRELIDWIVPGYFGWHDPTYHGPKVSALTCFYLGLLPLALASGSLLAKGFREPMQRWMLGLALLSLLLGLDISQTLHRILFLLPFYSSFRRWVRTFIFLNFAICVLAACGWQALGDLQSLSRARIGIGAFCFFAIAVALMAGVGVGPEALRAASLPGISAALGSDAFEALKAISMASVQHTILAASLLLLLAAGFSTKRLWLLLGLLVAFHAWDMQQVTSKYIRMVDPSQVTTIPDIASFLPPPEAPLPWRLYVHDSYALNGLSSFGYECLQGNHGLPMAATQDIIHAMAGRQEECLDMFNVRYVIGHSPFQRRKLAEVAGVGVFENPRALERAWLVGEEILVKDQAEALQHLAMPSFHPQSQVLLDEQLNLPGSPALGTIQWLDRSSNSFELEVNSKQHAALVVSNPWYPAWKAWIDGKPVRVLKANAGLQAIDLPAGRHQVKFSFSAGALWLGFVLAAIGLLLLLLVFLLQRRPRLAVGTLPLAAN